MQQDYTQAIRITFVEKTPTKWKNYKAVESMVKELNEIIGRTSLPKGVSGIHFDLENFDLQYLSEKRFESLESFDYWTNFHDGHVKIATHLVEVLKGTGYLKKCGTTSIVGDDEHGISQTKNYPDMDTLEPEDVWTVLKSLKEKYPDDIKYMCENWDNEGQD